MTTSFLSQMLCPGREYVVSSANDCSIALFSSLGAYSSWFTAGTLAVEVIAEGSLKTSTSFNAFIRLSAAPKSVTSVNIRKHIMQI